MPAAALVTLPPGQTTAQREHDLAAKAGMTEYWAELEVACSAWCALPPPAPACPHAPHMPPAVPSACSLASGPGLVLRLYRLSGTAPVV